jgi:cytoskeletal protein CcmA (bactofilin family)
MWGNKKSHTPQAADPEPKNWQTNQPPAGATARLGSSLHVKGEISGNEDLYIEGTVEGLVRLGEGKLTVGATANVTADVIAREVVVCGKVKGNVHAKSKIEIKKDGSVIGDLTTAQIIIEDGAYFKGSIEIDRAADKETDNKVSPGTTFRPTTSSAAGGAEEYLITKECLRGRGPRCTTASN